MTIDYKNRAVLTHDDSEAVDVDYLVESTKLQFETALLDSKNVLSKTKVKLSELKTAYPLNVSEIMGTIVEIELYEKIIEHMNKLGKELGFIKE